MKIFSNRLLLITRPIQESLAFSEMIKNFNKSINTICDPLFEIENLAIKQDMSNIRGAIVTSSNAIRSLVQSQIMFSCPVFCVGNSTALSAKNAGFNSISSDGNVYYLYELIQNLVTSGSEQLIYFRGEEIVGDLGTSLREKNYNVDEVICYRKLPRELPRKTLADIESGLIFGAVFFSKQTASLFSNQIKRIPDGFIAFCISKEVSRTFSNYYPKTRLSLRVAEAPSMIEMCKLVVAASEFGA